MKKLYLIVISIILLVLGFWVGRFMYKINTIDSYLLAEVKEKYSEIEDEYNLNKRIAQANNTSDTKLSPNAILVFKTEYEKCGHTLNEYKKIPKEYVNLNEDELKEKFKDWNIEEFSEKEVVLLKKEAESCDEHFIIRENSGNLAVYKVEANDNEVLKDITSISVKYLTKADLDKLKEGIRVNGVEALNAKLEDFE